MTVFQQYSKYYDLLYRDKDYAGEAAYVGGRIREIAPWARTILEFGSGTGRHGRLLADLGFEVYGIERSAGMVAAAEAAVSPSATGGSFRCEVGDICAADLGRRFDAVIALFHVVCYQTSDAALAATFQAASRHLSAGGVFLFDVWHGPAVIRQGASHRVKEVADGPVRVKRSAHPEVDSIRKTVNVVFDLDCEDRSSGDTVRFREEHELRYLFPEEIDELARACGLRVVVAEEFLSAHPVSADTWGVCYVLQVPPVLA